MARKLIVIILIINSLIVFGQDHFIGFNGGLNITNISRGLFPEYETFRHQKYRIGIIGGIRYEFWFLERFNIGIDFLYNQHRFAYTYNPFDDKIHHVSTYNYISYPIKLGYVVGDKIGITINIGIVPSYLLNAIKSNYNYDENGNFTGVSSYQMDREHFEIFDFAGLAELGVKYGLYYKVDIYSTIMFRHSNKPFSDSRVIDDAGWIHYGFSWIFGLKYKLNK